jgi:hypothetical protein
MAPTEGSPIPMPGDELLAPTRMAVLGTILTEPLVLAMRSYANTMRTIRTQQGLPLPPAKWTFLDSPSGSLSSSSRTLETRSMPIRRPTIAPSRAIRRWYWVGARW